VTVADALPTDADIANGVEVLKANALLTLLLITSRDCFHAQLTRLVTDLSMYSWRPRVITIKSACSVRSFCIRKRT